jgi:23S rRNA (adenine2503-C2)-methyltransferase
MQKNLFHLTKEQLKEELISLEEKPFRAKQIWNWLYIYGAKNFDEMTNISKKTREILAKNYSLKRPEITKDIISSDGTRKFLVKFSDCKEVEAVFIPEKTRGTLCISSQVGCSLACKFCHTGTQVFVRNLEFHEILAQIIIAKDLLNDWPKDGKADSFRRKLTNIVYMGMGEPFFNYDNVKKSVQILNDVDGLSISNRKITISTSGLVPEIIQASRELKTGLAISFHGTNDDLRTSIMAINKKYPINELLKACKIYNNENPSQKITFEYVMLDGVNDSKEHANELVKLVKKFNLNIKINIIPFNTWDGCEYNKTKEDKIVRFQKSLKNSGLIATIRKTRGDDVLAACGQLKSLSKRLPKRLKIN